MTEYTNLHDITELQQVIVRYVDYWVHVEKTPVPQKNIIEEMVARGKKSSAIVHSLKGLIKLGYLRQTVATSNKTSYVQLRRI
jgi:hypothetical protein